MSSARQPSAPIRIVQITDFHLLASEYSRMLGVETQASLEAVLETVVELRDPPDLFLLTGDLVQDPEAATYRRLRRLLSEMPAPVYCLPGNHDDVGLMSELLVDGRSILQQARIALTGWDIVCLNSTIANDPCGYLSDDELALLGRTLDEIPPANHVLVSFHHSPVLIGSRWLDTMVLGNADALFACLNRYPNVRGIIIGHVHQHLDARFGPYRLLACPSTCFQFKPLSRDFALDPLPPGFRWLDLYPDGHLETAVERLVAVPSGLDLASGGY
ncbi:MAG: 3',5'-cyclic-AMP phosphodiesterase [Methylococcaceae bacterium]|nr:3',5'-cyclic-AMP phosphodiesterase [Methylococcaceae bacterium]